MSSTQDIIKQLESLNQFKVFENLDGREPISVYNDCDIQLDKLHRVCIIDTETTGLDTESCEIIELGYKVIEFDSNGLFYRTIYSEDFFMEPSSPITEEITKITGITNEDVAGKSIPWDVVAEHLSGVSLIIAHNAGFDRKVLERYSDIFVNNIWGCSVQQIDWGEVAGIHSRSQEFLCFKYGGFVYNAHRAVDDVEALAYLLSIKNDNGKTPFYNLIANIRKKQYKVKAVGAPFRVKDDLKASGYRWNAAEKLWESVIDDADLKDEISRLNDLGCKNPSYSTIKAKDRFSIREQ